jgi:hypothetical protein
MNDNLIIRCQCGVEYLEFVDLSGGGFEDYALSITCWPYRFTERLKAAWQALLGHKFYYNEVCLNGADMRRLRDWLLSTVPVNGKKG